MSGENLNLGGIGGAIAGGLDFLDKAQKALAYFGYLKKQLEASGLLKSLAEAIALFQKFHGLPATGDIDGATKTVLEMPRCGRSDAMAIVAMETGMPVVNCMWPKSSMPVSIWLGNLPPTLSVSDWKNVFATALDSWKSVCDIKWDFSLSSAAADIMVFSGKEDGPSNTLAWCELPCFGGGDVRQLQMKLDVDEKWGTQIDPVCVVAHELGHGLGLEHIPRSSGIALMNPIYNASIKKPQTLDVQAIVGLYGGAAPQPTPIPTPQPTPNPGATSFEGTFVLGGERWVFTGGKAVKLVS